MYFMRVNKSTPVTPISGRGSTLGGYSEIRIGAARFRAMHWIYIISVHKPNNQFSVCLTEKRELINVFLDKNLIRMLYVRFRI